MSLAPQEAREEFLNCYKAHITRKGSDKLLAWLEGGDFFKAPASTRYHLAEEGGLCQHSLHVYQRLVKAATAEGLGVSEETVAICGLLHDVCKAGFYKQETRNTKVNGVWTEVPYYTIEDQFPFGHGEKSVFIIERFMRLTSEEALAIRWHMGGFDEAAKGGSFSVSAAFEESKLAVLLHTSDLQASYLDEARA